MNQKIPPYQAVGGDLAAAAVRAHYFRLRCLPSTSNKTTGYCRLCNHGRENCHHLIECPGLPMDWLQKRQAVIEAIAKEAKVRLSSTRSSDMVRHWFYELKWTNQIRRTLIKALAFFRDIINMYAGLPPGGWEGAKYASLPVPRIRIPRLPRAIPELGPTANTPVGM